MANAKLLLKLGNFYVVQDYGAKIDYITVPNYNYCSRGERNNTRPSIFCEEKHA